MKQSLESAKRRRGAPTPSQPQTAPNVQTKQNVPSPASVLTIPQVIDNIGKRLIILETFMNETKQGNVSSIQRNVEKPIIETISTENTNQLDEIVDEFDKRHQILATEIASLKDIVLNLQKYTMDVNKMLLEERAHIINEVENREQQEIIEDQQCNENE